MRKSEEIIIIIYYLHFNCVWVSAVYLKQQQQKKVKRKVEVVGQYLNLYARDMSWQTPDKIFLFSSIVTTLHLKNIVVM